MASVGEIVWLKANDEEGWPREQAEVLAISRRGVITAEVLLEYRGDDFDDGLREVTEDQIE